MDNGYTIVMDSVYANAGRYSFGSPTEGGGFQRMVLRNTYLSGQIVPSWKLIQPLRLLIERDEDGTYIASEDIFRMYGTGRTPDEAVADYAVSLVDLYEFLEARLESNPLNRPRFGLLTRYLQPLSLSISNAA
jgi:hypothetical protein